ncbi:MAG: hypothetical protein V2A79_17895 [Planctomycetota bacterium]
MPKPEADSLLAEYCRLLMAPTPDGDRRATELGFLLFAPKEAMQCPRCHCPVQLPSAEDIVQRHRAAVSAYKTAVAAIAPAEERYRDAQAAVTKSKEAYDDTGQKGLDVTWHFNRLRESQLGFDGATRVLGDKRGQLYTAQKNLQALGLAAEALGDGKGTE